MQQRGNGRRRVGGSFTEQGPRPNRGSSCDDRRRPRRRPLVVGSVKGIAPGCAIEAQRDHRGRPQMEGVDTAVAERYPRSRSP